MEKPFPSSQASVPPPIIEKPASVTVFGVLNCVFGGLSLLCTPCNLFGLLFSEKFPWAQGTMMQMDTMYKIILMFMSVVGIGFSIWLIILGIGLLTSKKWARSGCVIYGILTIIWVIAGIALNIAAMKLHWIDIPSEGMPGYIGGICGGLCGGLIYPILLLIFMLTPKVKQYFTSLG